MPTLKAINVYFTSLKQKFQLTAYKEIVNFLVINLLLMGVTYGSSLIYATLSLQDLTEVTPLTWFFALCEKIQGKLPLTSWGVLFLSSVIPIMLVAYLKFGYERWGFRAIQWLLKGLFLLFVWSCMAGTILLLWVTHNFSLVSPLVYLQAWIRFANNPASHSALLLSGGGAGILIAAISLLLIKEVIPNIYGNAHFANADDIKKSGLFAEDGFLLGKAFGRDLCVGGYEHIIIFAPTGLGKTLAYMVPNLLYWQGSAVVSDIKSQLFDLTSKYRQSIGQDVYKFSPASPDGQSHCYNPLDIISQNPHTRIDDIQKIAAIFIPDNPKSEPIWQVQSRFLFVALVLYVLDTPGYQKTITEVVQLVKAQPDFAKFVKEELAARTDLDSLCRYNLMKFSELHEKTRLSILATFQSYFELFDNPLIVAATSKSDFDIRDLRRKRMTIYVSISNDNLVRLAPLLTVFYQQVADVLTRKLPGNDEPYGVTFFLDEFSALRRMESFHKNIGLYREYRLRMAIIVQEISQLYDLYGRDGAKVFINSKVRVAFTQNDEETCKLIESMLGDQTLRVTNQSRKIDAGVLASSNKNESSHYVKRPLMLAHEIRLLPENKALIIVQGHSPVYANKLVWFKDKRFKNKMLGAIEVPSILPTIIDVNTLIFANPRTDFLKKECSLEKINDKTQEESLDQSLD